jgi:gamma-glutamyl-gamma-aminobutyrate hydrolase PuuD
MNKILVVNGNYYANAIEGLGEFVFDIDEFFEKPEDFKLVMFTGGEDVSPSLYGHTSPNHVCGYNTARDAEEIPIFEKALKFGIPMTGICRGSQLLNVLSGGVMMHHITNHSLGGTHTMSVTNSTDIIEVTSTHHQMSVPSNQGFILGWSTAKRSTVYIGDKDEEVTYDGQEVEAIYYPHTKVFAVQYHPEYMNENSTGYKWYKQGVEDLLTLTEDEFKSKYVKPMLKTATM